MRRSEFDLFWTSSGDFAFEPTKKDFKNTKIYNYRSMIQRILTRVMSSPGDWEFSPQLGAGLESFLGKKNTEALGNEIQLRIENELITANFLSLNEFLVNVFPISKEEIGIVIEVTPNNQRESILLKFTYNASDNRVVHRSF